MTSEISLVALFVRPLNRLRLPYLVTGGVASVIYGEPRFTRDIDVVLQLKARDAGRFAAAWDATAFSIPPIEVLEESRRPTAGHFKISHHETAIRADVYLAGEGGADEWSALNGWSFEHRVVRQVGDDEVVVAPIEAVILNKLRDYQIGGSGRHLRDIGAMLQISGSLVDQAELERWAGRLGVEKELAQARAYREEY